MAFRGLSSACIWRWRSRFSSHVKHLVDSGLHAHLAVWKETAMHGTYQTFSARETGQSVARLEALAKLMDGAFVLPGTNIRMGLDGLIGLIPVAGDMICGLISGYLIWEARQL